MVDQTDQAWRIAMLAACHAAAAETTGQPEWFVCEDSGEWRGVPAGDPVAQIAWEPDTGWTALLPPDDPRRVWLDLYLPIASASARRPMVVGHLGQSLDGFIATSTGDSQFVTGPGNIMHLHRMRALCDAVIVGAGTVAADDPQLTTRHVAGANPLRVVFDPGRRLSGDYRIFHDATAPTLYVCTTSLMASGETHVGHAPIVGLDHLDDESGLVALVQLLRARGCHRIFVEGGGVTVSAFLEANLLQRLHVAIAPLIIGEGRPAIRLAGRPVLRDCRRPGYRVFRMGGDILFDCDLTATTATDAEAEQTISRII